MFRLNRVSSRYAVAAAVLLLISGVVVFLWLIARDPISAKPAYVEPTPDSAPLSTLTPGVAPPMPTPPAPTLTPTPPFRVGDPTPTPEPTDEEVRRAILADWPDAWVIWIDEDTAVYAVLHLLPEQAAPTGWGIGVMNVRTGAYVSFTQEGERMGKPRHLPGEAPRSVPDMLAADPGVRRAVAELVRRIRSGEIHFDRQGG